MSDTDRSSKILIEEDVKFGTFANAFRVVEDVGGECLLDFLVYSSAEDQATVVSRIRLRKEFIPRIREKLLEAMEEFEDADLRSALLSDASYRKTKETIH